MEVGCTFGPPGCGKTQHLINIANGEVKKASRVLFLSFTKAAAAEAASRLNSDRILPSTIHSFAFRQLGLTRDQVVDENKLAKFSEEIGVPLKAKDEDALQIGDEYLDVISFAANQNIDKAEAYEIFGRPGRPQEFMMFSRGYHHWKNEFGYMDFDDMLLHLMNFSDMAIPPVLILDEAQDCSPLQWDTFRHLAKFTKRVYIAGDDDQAIYEWSGADPHGMIAFADQYSANVEVLEQSHRMPPSVHQFVHDEILNQFETRQEKKFHPKIGGFDHGVTRYGSFHDVDPNEVNEHNSLILVRDRFRMLDAKKILNAHTIPYRIMGGSSPFDNVKVNAVRATVRLNMGEPASERELYALALALQDSSIKKGDYSRVLGQRWQDVIPLTENQREFYESIDLFAPIRVTLSTIHQAKGREADRVYVDLELTPRVIENATRNRDAELRVMYVACTRAREGLSLCAENPLI